MRMVALGGVAFVLGWVQPVHATYSVVGADESTGQVGGAAASCVRSDVLRLVYGAAPGRGVIHAQALLGGPHRREEAVRLLAAGEEPSAILARLIESDFDPSFARRQYGIVDLMGRTAGFTGEGTGAFAADRQGSAGTFHYSVQGNILTGESVLDRMEAAFQSTGCDLADRLMLSLEAGGTTTEGDSRCTDEGIPADSAYLQVDLSGEASGSYLMLEVNNVAPEDPIALLRAEYDRFRMDNPCPIAEPDESGRDVSMNEPGLDATLGEPGMDAAADSVDRSGCACHSGAPGSTWTWILAALVLWSRRFARG